MNIYQARTILNDAGYVTYKPQLPMNEGVGDIFKVVKKIGSLLSGWRKEMKQAEEDGDDEKKEEIADKAEQLKNEIESNDKIVERFSPKFRKIVMAGILALMAMGASTQAHAAANASANYGGSHTQSSQSWGGTSPEDALERAINASCRDTEHCVKSGNGVNLGDDDNNSKHIQTSTPSWDEDSDNTYHWKKNGSRNNNGELWGGVKVDLDGDGSYESAIVFTIDANNGDITDAIITAGPDKGRHIDSADLNQKLPGVQQFAALIALSNNKI